MKTIFILICLSVISLPVMAQRNGNHNNEIIGTWKFSCQSAINDFQKIFNQKGDFRTEYFTFATNHSFIHEFADKDDNLVKTLSGKWKFVGTKIRIDYAEVDFTLLLEYFFIDKDLVLGQNFNHVIFTREDVYSQHLIPKLSF